MWGATLKLLHLHNPSTNVGNMEVFDRLEKVNFDLRFFYTSLCLPTAIVIGSNYLLLPTHELWHGL